MNGQPIPSSFKNNDVLICVYCIDSTNRYECERVVTGIRNLNLEVKVTAPFKADGLTLAGLDSKAFAQLGLSDSWQLHLDIREKVFCT